MRETLTIERVVKLAEDGETFTLEAGDCPIADLIYVAKVIGGTRACVRFSGLRDRSIEDLMQITVASQGRVILDSDAVPTGNTPPVQSGWFRRLRRASALRVWPAARRAA